MVHDRGFRLRNDLYCVEWGVKLYSLTTGEGWMGGRQKETVSLQPDTRLPVTQRRRSTGLGRHYGALPIPAGSDKNSQLSITLKFLRINQS